MMKAVLCALGLLVAGLSGAPAQEAWFAKLPGGGVVPDAATARAIAEAIFIPIGGKESLAQKRPLEVRRKGNVWIVTPSYRRRKLPPGHIPMRGGGLRIEISAVDGRVLKLLLGK